MAKLLPNAKGKSILATLVVVLFARATHAEHLRPTHPLLSGTTYEHEDHNGHFHAGEILTRIQFHEADLTGTDFSQANLNYAVFRNSTLINSDLSRAILRHAEFENSALIDTDFSQADLNHADFWNSTVIDADFTGAHVGGVSFRGTTARGFTKEQLYSTASFQAGDLSGINLSRNNLSEWNFTGRNLNGVGFSNATLTNANFTGAHVQDARFWETTESGFTKEQLYSTASYQAGDLSGIGLVRNDLSGWDFTGQNLAGASFSRATLTNADFTAHVQDARFWETTANGFTKEQFYSTASYQAGDLSGVGLGSNDLSSWDFTGQNLAGASFSRATLTNGDFTGADVQDVSFWGTTANGFTKEQLFSTASYKSRNLSGLDLRGNDLSGWSFAGQILAGVEFSTATLTNADFTGVHVQDASFASLFTPNKSFTSGQLYSTASYKSRNLRGLDLRGNDLSDWNFAGQTLTDVSFVEATLAGADFTGADVRDTHFPYAKGFTREQLYSTASYKSGDLSHIDLGGNDLSDWNFAGQTLAGVSFVGTTLSGADFTGADVRSAHFGYSTSKGFTKEQLYSTASYQTGDLSGIVLGESNLTDWIFTEQDLSRGSFAYATLSGVDFNNATLDGVDFRRADFTGALNADLSFTDLRGARGISDDMLDSADNVIRRDGSIRGLHLGPSEHLVARNDYFVGITVTDELELHADSKLEFIIAHEVEDPFTWDVPVQLTKETQVDLAGTLEISVPTDEYALEPWRGTTIDLFDWHGSLAPGDKFDIVTSLAGVWDISQLYDTGEVTFLGTHQSLSDINVDGLINASDIDLLSSGVRSGIYESIYDLDGNGVLNQVDRRVWVEDAIGTLFGDANLNMTVEFADFLSLSNNFGEPAGWADGDFDGSGDIQFADFLLLATNFGQATTAVASVPEPDGRVTILIVAFFLLRARRFDNF